MNNQNFEDIWRDPRWSYLTSGFRPEEGFTARYPGKSLLLSKYASMLPEKSSVIEIGFNMGHGAFSLLREGKNIIEFISFDICFHEYVKEIWRKFSEEFPSFHTVEGDTTLTLAEISQRRPASFDLIHIDGGHSYEIAKSDLEFSIALAREGSYIILDDFNIPDIQKSYSEINKRYLDEVEEIHLTSGGSLSDVGNSRQSISKVLRRTSYGDQRSVFLRL